MMLTILQTKNLAFIIIFIFSSSFFNALAAPVPVTLETFSGLSKRELQHGNGNGLYARQNVQSRDIKVSDVLVGTPASKASYVSAPAGQGPQTLVRRGFFDGIKNAFKKVGSAISSGFNKVKDGIKNVAQKVASGVKNVAQKAVTGVKNVAQKVASGVKNVAQKAVTGVKNVAQKVASGVKNVAEKVKKGVGTAVNAVGKGIKTATKWVKENGAKIAKGGLKVLATVGSVASKVANFIPIAGLNKTLSKGLKYASMAMDMGSNAIKADLGSFGKAADVMNKIQHPISGVGGQVLDAVLGRDIAEVPLLRRDLKDPFFL